MSTDLHDRTAKPSDEGPGKPEKPKPALSVAQVVGGALAAMTAAALGSRLSVAGTVVGAALASVVAAVAGSIYTSSLRRTSQHVTKVIANRRPGTDPTGSAGSPAATATGASPTAVQDPAPATSGTRTDWGWGDRGTATSPEVGQDPTADPAPDAGPAQRRPRAWKPVVLGALLMFVIAALVLTGFELATGRALSGGNGTTVGQVAEGRTDPTPRRSPTPSATPSATATPTTSATAAPVPSASSTPSSEPTAAPSASETAAPSASPTPSASALPSSSATPGVAPTA